jgi:hypothetical protein
MNNNLAINRRKTGLMKKPRKDVSVPVIVWDNLMDCDSECVCVAECEQFGLNSKCAKQADYLSHVLNSAAKTYGSYMNEKMMVQIGLHIMPLYGHLFKLKLVESTLSINRMITINKKGTYRTHPVYKEIRDTLNTLDNMWNRIGVKSFDLKVGRFEKDSDTSYIDALSEAVDE